MSKDSPKRPSISAHSITASAAQPHSELTEPQPLLKKVGSETLLLAAAPLAGYLITFANEAGFLTYFSAPIELVDIATTDLLLRATIFAAFTWSFIVHFNILMLGFQLKKTSVRKWILSFVGYSIALMVARYLVNLTFLELLSIVVPPVLFCVFAIALPIYQDITTHRERSFGRHITFAVNLVDLIRKVFGWAVLLLIAAISVSSALAFAVGRTEAVRQRAFYVLESENPAVVLRIYGNKMIGMPLEGGIADASKGIVIINLERVSVINLRPVENVSIKNTKSQTISDLLHRLYTNLIESISG